MSFTDIETALAKIAADNGLTYVGFDRHEGPHRVFYSCKGHRGKLAKAGLASTLEEAITAMLASDFLDTEALEREEAA